MKITKLKPYFLPVAILFAVLAIVDFAQARYGWFIFNACLAVIQLTLHFKIRDGDESPKPKS